MIFIETDKNGQQWRIEVKSRINETPLSPNQPQKVVTPCGFEFYLTSPTL